MFCDRVRRPAHILVGLIFVVGSLALSAEGTTRYVSPSGKGTSPYTSWDTAARDIQSAVNVAVNGDTVLVADGAYWLTSEILVSSDITIRSVNGPAATTVNGQSTTRCFNLGSRSCVLSGFTVTNGFATGGFGSLGGGILCSSMDPVITNCVVSGSYATEGGGIYLGTVHNSTIRNNRAFRGGGLSESTAVNCLVILNYASERAGAMYSGKAVNCTIADNSASNNFDGEGGVWLGTVINCIAWDNSFKNLNECVVFNTCTQDFYPGNGNVPRNPSFLNQSEGDYRLAPDSPCIGLGDNSEVMGATDLDGNPRIGYGAVDMGAYEFFTDVYHVAPGGSATAPYATWASAARDIQSAVDLAEAGQTVLVADGTYGLTQEIVVSEPITLASTNGPDATVIDGNGSVRCLNLGNAACLVSGFTIRNGFTDDGDGDGAGVFCSGGAPVVSNCTFSGNMAYDAGGGMLGGTAKHCVFTGNDAYLGGGLSSGTADHCTFTGNLGHQNGGAIYNGTANHCIITGNESFLGGGLLNAAANDCLIAGNTATETGGGMYGGTARNCTFFGNYAEIAGGGVYQGTAHNCVIWYNANLDGPQDIAAAGTISYSCSPDVTHGLDGNITNAPMFIDRLAGNFRLAFLSPAIDVGNPAQVVHATDLDGGARVVNGTVDMGAYEYDAQLYDSDVDGVPDWWGIQFFGSATGGVASGNGDVDPMLNGEEYIAGTDPTNAASYFAVTSFLATEDFIYITWTSVPGRVYSVFRADEPSGAFRAVVTDWAYPLNSYTDYLTNGEPGGVYSLGVRMAD